MKQITAKYGGTYILVADDYIVNQELVKEMLEMMECEVDVADDGKETLDMFNENEYDIIFLDIQMPEMDGYEVARRIRQVAKGKQIPIVAITANALVGDREKCLDAGMNDYMPKPIKGERLEEMLRKHLPNKEQH
ncbi:MAG: response regulator [Alphaproteobacteria bacterium]|nr:response regulator [Alphaproteobacteria bacterium]